MKVTLAVVRLAADNSCHISYALMHRNNFVEGLAGFRPMMLACGMSEAGAKVFAQPARLPVLDACVLLANGDHPRPLLHQDLMLWIG